MTSKRTAASKRTSPPRATDYTKAFLKDWERLSRSGRFDMNRLKEAMMRLIAHEAPLGAEWLDHPLSGNREGCRECHIGGDFLLLYRLDDKNHSIVFVRTGTHAELFE
jgi:mRNA interferase YafQ